jgi:hypothetical protein
MEQWCNGCRVRIVSDLKPDRQCRDLHKSNLPATSWKIGPVLIRTKAKLKRVSALESEDNRIWRSLAPEFEAMANKSLCEFSAPTTTNIRTGLEVNIGDNGFKLKPALINMVQAS